VILEILKQGIASVPPGRTIQRALGAPHDSSDSDAYNAYRVRIEAEGPFGLIEPQEYMISVDVSVPSVGPFHSVMDCTKFARQSAISPARCGWPPTVTGDKSTHRLLLGRPCRRVSDIDGRAAAGGLDTPPRGIEESVSPRRRGFWHKSCKFADVGRDADALRQSNRLHLRQLAGRTTPCEAGLGRPQWRLTLRPYMSGPDVVEHLGDVTIHPVHAVLF
jgi:hypothetical protein